MKISMILSFAILLIFCRCSGQTELNGKFIGYKYVGSKNSSFVTKTLIFVRLNDTLKLNIKAPYDSQKSEVMNNGIFYNCQLQEGIEYHIKLKKICVTDIPSEVNSYYKINATSTLNDCSKFTEIVKDSKFEVKGNYGKYVDLDHTLYEIVNVSPPTGCMLPH